MRKLLLNAIATAVGALALASGAQAITVTMSTGLTNGNKFNTDGFGSFLAATSSFVSAAFDYTGPISFSNTLTQNTTSAGDLNRSFFDATKITGYTSFGGTLGTPANADFSTVGKFLASSGSNAGYGYGSLLTFDLGNLTAGTTLTIRHDDGVSLYQGGNKLGGFTNGPTVAITESVTLTNSGETLLFYSRQNGTPSVLNVSVAAIPEPETYALMAAGLLGIAFMRRRANKA